MTALPEAIVNLKKLRFLDLRANKLVALPVNLAELPHLEKLDLRWNRLAYEPEWLSQLAGRGCTIFI